LKQKVKLYRLLLQDARDLMHSKSDFFSLALQDEIESPTPSKSINSAQSAVITTSKTNTEPKTAADALNDSVEEELNNRGRKRKREDGRNKLASQEGPARPVSVSSPSPASPPPKRKTVSNSTQSSTPESKPPGVDSRSFRQSSPPSRSPPNKPARDSSKDPRSRRSRSRSRRSNLSSSRSLSPRRRESRSRSRTRRRRSPSRGNSRSRSLSRGRRSRSRNYPSHFESSSNRSRLDVPDFALKPTSQWPKELLQPLRPFVCMIEEISRPCLFRLNLERDLCNYYGPGSVALHYIPPAGVAVVFREAHMLDEFLGNDQDYLAEKGWSMFSPMHIFRIMITQSVQTMVFQGCAKMEQCPAPKLSRLSPRSHAELW
jgi:hypothetical protein